MPNADDPRKRIVVLHDLDRATACTVNLSDGLRALRRLCDKGSMQEMTTQMNQLADTCTAQLTHKTS